MTLNRESYERAAGALAALTATADDLMRTGDELLSIAALLGRESRLRRALVDPARESADRESLLGALLAGKIDASTQALAGLLVSSRWATGGELRDAFERLAVDALLAGAESAGELADVEDELFRFGRIVAASPQLSATLGDLAAPLEHRQALVSDLLAGKARPATMRLVVVALTGFGGRGFTASCSRLVELAAAARTRQVAYVVSAVPLSDADEERLRARLASIYGHEMSIKTTVDPGVLGGMSVQVGSDLYDGTVRRRLTDIRGALAG